MGSWVNCECDGGFYDYGNQWEGGRREECDLCEGVGKVEFPLTRRVARIAAKEGILTDGYLCVSDLTEGRCDHCTELAEKEFSYMASEVRAHRAAGLNYNPYASDAYNAYQGTPVPFKEFDSAYWDLDW